jgi:hypothetical protein
LGSMNTRVSVATSRGLAAIDESAGYRASGVI